MHLQQRATPTPRLLPALLAVAGVLHLTNPAFYTRIVPPWMPEPRALVLVSGVALLAGAAGLCVDATRRAAAWGVLALLAAVFPANVQMLRAAQADHAGMGWQALLWLRLPLQPLLGWWVWRAALSPPPLTPRP